MAFLSYEEIAATDTIKALAALSVPVTATHAQLQSSTQDVRYTMDDTTNPAQTSGMILKTGLAPETFLIEDLRNIRFVRGSGSNGILNIHYFG